MQARGYLVVTSQDKIDEKDSITCVHCNAVFFVAPKQHPSDAGGYCRQCDALICRKCTAEGRCLPLERRLEHVERVGKWPL